MIAGTETVLERVLLAIIAAHPASAESDQCVERRLGLAMKALLGPSTTRNGAIDKALANMIRERRRDICNAEMSAFLPVSNNAPARSVASLAESAAHEILGLDCPLEVREAKDLLCREYKRQAVESDPAIEALRDEAVSRILCELAEWDAQCFSMKQSRLRSNH
ncbi:hypothetical protein FF124_01665 [Martelella lutilitoris]|uniref:Uncharacterized protein n=1 Tax=Martelella lutilitoris TaxID=2583532 RepID=A0A5C4JW75_9HYPH|nr:hypothetical protein [Martelella lutilitoris]TNB49693.1 hypothetical protein FF124_01665 [Martelella lutilitoris]